MSQKADTTRSILYALGANCAIFAAKLATALVTGSGAMLAEAVHSLADTGNQGLLLFGGKMAKSPPSPDYPLGRGKEIYFWSFVVALMLFSMGGLFSIHEGLNKLRAPEPISRPWIAIGVLLFAIVSEAFSLWGCVREVNHERRGRGFVRWFRETRNSALLVVFGEDVSALAGLALALAAIVASVLTGNPLYDALGSMAIGCLLIVVALCIGLEVKSLLVGRGVDPVLKEEMLALLHARPEIHSVYNLLTLQMGEDVMVAVKARMRPAGSEERLLENINACEAALREAYPQVLWLFFEPDNRD